MGTELVVTWGKVSWYCSFVVFYTACLLMALCYFCLIVNIFKLFSLPSGIWRLSLSHHWCRYYGICYWGLQYLWNSKLVCFFYFYCLSVCNLWDLMLHFFVEWNSTLAFSLGHFLNLYSYIIQCSCVTWTILGTLKANKRTNNMFMHVYWPR